MLTAIGVLLLMAGISILVIGLARYFFTPVERLVPNGLRFWFETKTGLLFMAIGLLLIVSA